jgi:hypothetical protein
MAIVAAPALLFADPGFGTLRKKVIDLRTRRPALVRLANTSLAIKGNASDAQYQNALPSLVATLETELLSNEKTLVKKPEGQAEWMLAVTITGFQLPAPTMRTQRSGNASQTFRRWTGTMNVAYQVVDQGGRVHDADNVAASYDKEIDANAPKPAPLPIRIPGLPAASKETSDPNTQEDVKQLLIRDVVQRIASNLGNTVQVIEARIAGGDPALDRAGDFMSQRLWSRATEELEKQPAFAKPQDESYRQYSLGLAYEAMSYDSKVVSEQRANLFKAQEYYDKAAELNPGQRYFVEVVARTKDSVARYRTLEAMSKEDRSKQPPPGATARSADVAASAPAPATKAATLTVDDVIKMHAAQVPAADVIRLINSSDLSFALDVDTLIKLSSAKLPLAVENAMRAKSGLPLREDAVAGPSTGRGGGRGAPAGARATPAPGTSKP